MLAERELVIDVMKEIAKKNGERTSSPRSSPRYAIERGLSHRRACALMKVSRLTIKSRTGKNFFV
jgi:hypothetical protein